MKALLLVLLILPQVAGARVFMCVDEATGKASFTDKGCDTAGSREEVRVKPTNLESGQRSSRAGPAGVWNSDRDTRKTGIQYNAQRREMYENRATAQRD